MQHDFIKYLKGNNIRLNFRPKHIFTRYGPLCKRFVYPCHKLYAFDFVVEVDGMLIELNTEKE